MHIYSTQVSYALRMSFPSVTAAADTARDTLNCGVTVGRCDTRSRILILLILVLILVLILLLLLQLLPPIDPYHSHSL